MAGIKDYSTTAASNTSVGGISIAEGMLPSNINNAMRAILADVREWYNDAEWVIYGDGDGSHTFAYASATSFTVAGSNVTSLYHAGRRIKAVGSSTGTIVGTISSSSFSSDTTVNVTWDSGSLSSESLTIYLAILAKTNNSIPTDVIDTAHLKTNAVTTVKITDANVTAAKLATNAVEAAKINASAVTSGKIAGDAIDGSKIADDAINSEHYTDGSIDTAHIADSQVTTAKIADDGVTAAKIADAVIVTNSEHSGSTPDDVTFFTTSASDARYFRQDSSETIDSGDTWSAGDTKVATTAAIDARVIDLVDDVGGFVPIANELAFPNANPDVNDGAGTLVSIKTLSTNYTSSGSGVITVANGTVGNSTVTINGAENSTTYSSGYGMIVETTTTLNTYTFHRLVPKATEVTTVAGKATEIGRLGTADAVSDLNTLGTADAVSDMNTLAAISGLDTLASNSANVTTVANNISGVNSFADRYRIASSAPGSSLDVGDLYFDTTANELKVYKSSGWAAAGSTVNGTSQRYTYTISSGTPTTVTGSDDNGNTLAYDAGYADVYLNGVRMSSADITITSGTSVVFGSALTTGDVIDVVAYGTFDVASISAANIDSGTLNIARIADGAVTNAKLAGSIAEGKLAGSISNGKLANSSITINGSAVSLGGSVTIGETKPTVTSCTPNTITNDATNVVIAGTNFVSIPQVWALNPSTGIWYQANSITFTSATSITANFTLTVDAQYKIRIENPDGNAVISGSNLLTVSDAPTWSTAAGSLGTIAGDFSGTVATVAATGDSTIAYSEVGSVLTNASQANCTLNSSTGAITTSDFGGSSTSPTTYNFTIRATDAESQTTDRSFSLTSSFGATGGGQFN
tara:strand:+ start:705 stop:3299 length:2595 start_codon:yes stop_codon:yes gene_type:complete